MTKVLLNDLTVRDGNQSLLATRMEKEDIIRLVEKLDKVGYNALEVWGGATFDTALRFLRESPWEILREIRKAAKNTKLSMLLRGQNLVGYRLYDNETLERFIRLSIENGIDIIRVFDALNDMNNIEYPVKYIKKYGGHCQCAISYTVSPVHTESYFVDLVKQMAEMGADSICIKDMAGILMPDAAYSLVKALKAVTELPINIHSHTTAGLTNLVMLRAMEAGVDIVDTAISPFSGGTSHIAAETIIESAEYIGKQVAYSEEGLDEAYELADKVAQKYIDSNQYNARALVINPKILQYEVPGGMLSNLMSQLQDQNMFHKLNEVMREIPVVRKDMGYPPLVTPLSQMVGTQAMLNVLRGERYAMVPNEIKEYLRGSYGKSPAQVDPAVRAKILGDEPEIKPRAISELTPVFAEATRELSDKLGREALEEEVLSYILFPQFAVLVNEKESRDNKAQESNTNEVIEFEMFIER
ncbi:pyruvate carboxylase subunit B [Youngiibacter multivorans]|uniref:Oxaloacetate decarboxylase alpha subunit n=1 Tax=Youngiibacter multivorans TaxID=937251 RepID=A0ABS4G7K7_9CLOT|nr:pyruvate carboxylase subunit B [Youngiibacter multivorans]MBP1920528.1 oxaloacetate decarboxylase alpha subunit [Youngiibacter multivorans]